MCRLHVTFLKEVNNYRCRFTRHEHITSNRLSHIASDFNALYVDSVENIFKLKDSLWESF